MLISKNEEKQLKELIRPILFIPESIKVNQLLREFKAQHMHIAMVINEHGSITGLITLEDVLEEIVGEFGESDRPPVPDVVRDSDGSMIVRGSLSLGKLRELFNLESEPEPDEPFTTVAGLLNHLAGHVPTAGERIDYDGLKFEVLEANQRKVLRLRARRHVTAASAKS